MPAAYEISPGTVADIPELKTAFLSLHDHHRALSAVKLTEPDDRAWTERMHTYEQYFAEDRALLHLARIGGKCVGYAFTVVHAGSDDTFPLAAGYAELYTLAVVPRLRRSGIGTALLDVVDAALNDSAIPNLTVAVMAQNDAAIRLYRRRGLVPGSSSCTGSVPGPPRRTTAKAPASRTMAAAASNFEVLGGGVDVAARFFLFGS